MSSIDCSSGLRSLSWCPATTDEALPAVVGLLPRGPAWEAGRTAGTVQNDYWRSFASLAAFTYDRLCAYLKEFHCNTLVESEDQWAQEFDLDNPCDAFGGVLCAKVTAVGAQDCAHFVASAAAAGMAVTCDDFANEPQPIAGCFQAGCTYLGPAPEPAGPIYTYPLDDPEPAAGCFEAGCTGLNSFPGAIYDIIFFDCDNPLPDQRYEPADSTGHWRFGFGNAFTWRVHAAGLSSPDDPPQSNAGNFMAGCTPLCDPVPIPTCFLDQIKPAHALLIVTADI